MKRTIFVMVMVVVFHSLMAAQQNAAPVVPQAVQNAFYARFHDVKVTKWESRKEEYIARFKNNGKTWFAYYAGDGSWKGTETPIKWTKDLPDSVKAGWKSSGYYDWKVEDMKLIRTPEQVMYVLHVDNGSLLDSDHHDAFLEDWLLYFSPNGQLVRKVRKS